MGRAEDFSAETVVFDDFELDAQRRTLRRWGAEVDLRGEDLPHVLLVRVEGERLGRQPGREDLLGVLALVPA